MVDAIILKIKIQCKNFFLVLAMDNNYLSWDETDLREGINYQKDSYIFLIHQCLKIRRRFILKVVLNNLSIRLSLLQILTCIRTTNDGNQYQKNLVGNEMVTNNQEGYLNRDKE